MNSSLRGDSEQRASAGSSSLPFWIAALVIDLLMLTMCFLPVFVQKLWIEHQGHSDWPTVPQFFLFFTFLFSSIAFACHLLWAAILVFIHRQTPAMRWLGLKFCSKNYIKQDTSQDSIHVTYSPASRKRRFSAWLLDVLLFSSPLIFTFGLAYLIDLPFFIDLPIFINGIASTTLSILAFLSWIYVPIFFMRTCVKVLIEGQTYAMKCLGLRFARRDSSLAPTPISIAIRYIHLPVIFTVNYFFYIFDTFDLDRFPDSFFESKYFYFLWIPWLIYRLIDSLPIFLSSSLSFHDRYSRTIVVTSHKKTEIDS